MTEFAIRNATLVDVSDGSLHRQVTVQIVNGKIKAVDQGSAVGSGPGSIDAKGGYLLPGLCDAHVHVTAGTFDFAALTKWSPTYTAVRAAGILNDMLMRGFTTVRDAGGADFGIAQAINEGHIRGPRLLFGGKALSQTGGHGDMRGRGENVYDICYCCAGLGRICDGVSDVRRACRDEIRRGANHIKLMVSGGASSPTDRIDSTQFSIEEIRAAVEEADAANIYVMAHAYTARAANRALENGVRSIEHANLIDDSTRKILKEKNAFVVPTMITHQVATEIGHKIGLPPAMIEKTLQVVEAGRREHALSHKAGVKMAFGTDLLGEMHVHQLREFEMRSAFQDPIDTWRAATLTAAELFNMSGVIGVVRQGAHADLLVYDRNPLEDLGAVMAPEEHLKFIAKGGLIAKNAL